MSSNLEKIPKKNPYAIYVRQDVSKHSFIDVKGLLNVLLNTFCQTMYNSQFNVLSF